ncbi:toxin biosynthesis protein-like protein [Myriangium duriaei CBS 260.36]|uniref:Toxin biosynthesis protein-like protein n=1 Tax=Myriangium duriaei CBS 260.36 TaxID=1168546 RepID=A0A9P4IXC7_9PEZI|nr:toxin biosynthesis protein-like protein [Myriangium duriaei CBS 260.36]
MSAAYYTTTEYRVSAGHVREYAGATAGDQEAVLELAVKQYTPKKRADPLPDNAITILACPASGFPKELYEPIWDELLDRSRNHQFTIRSIWIADPVNAGQSSVWNEHKLSSEYSWWDHARDLLCLVNQFRKEMPRPIFGLGHSVGGSIISLLAILHPRLLTSLLLFDPMIQCTIPPGALAVIDYITTKPSTFTSRKEADRMVAQGSLFKNWDPRVRRLMVQYGLRDLPTAIHPLPRGCDPKNPPVTFTTTRDHDVWTWLRENFHTKIEGDHVMIDRRTFADMPPSPMFVPFYRPECSSLYNLMPTLRPSCLFLLSEKSWMNVGELRDAVRNAGVGIGGSGGIVEGRVRAETIPGSDHLFPLMAVAATADLCTNWLCGETQRFQNNEDDWRQSRIQKGPLADRELSEEWRAARRGWKPETKQRKHLKTRSNL